MWCRKGVFHHVQSRACGALLRDENILMVRHVHDGPHYWTLPGGGVHKGESPEKTVVREVCEETGLETKVVTTLFDEFYTGHKKYWCFLLAEADLAGNAVSGHDPEQHDVSMAERVLHDVVWFPIRDLKDDCQVSRVIGYLSQVREAT